MEAGKLEHRVARHDPQLAAFLSIAAPIAGAMVAAWAGPKLVPDDGQATLLLLHTAAPIDAIDHRT